MRILVTGNRGMLGTELMQVFGSSGELSGVDVDELDITDTERCSSLISDLAPDVIVNAAALTAVDFCESHADEAFRVNADGAGNLAAAAGGARLGHYSTDYVFDGHKPQPYTEHDHPAPRSVYGRSKLRGEELIRERCMNHLILRTAWLFGRHGNNFIRTILAAARAGRPLRVVNDQRGSPTYARDLAARTATMIETGCRGIFHVTNSGACTWYELAARVVEWSAVPGVSVTPVTTEEFPRLAPRPANSVLASVRLAEVGLTPMRPWQEAVQEYLREP